MALEVSQVESPTVARMPAPVTPSVVEATRPAPDVSPRPKLDVRGFSLYYGTSRALNGVTFESQERRVMAIIGPSGCGKSTLLRSVNRLNERVT
mgnify:CR=1 FL=1